MLSESMFKQILTIIVFCFSLSACTTWTIKPAPPPQPVLNIAAEAANLHAQDPSLKPQVARLALLAYNKAQQRGYGTQQKLTIIDYSQPSSQRRLWVVDLSSHRILFHELVSHGRNSGLGNYATAFSDRQNSLQSSLGVYVTGPQPYSGHFGYALRLQGLEPGFNNHAAARAIVMHGANYVTDEYVQQHGQAGHSWGCLALNPAVVKPVIDTIKGGTVIVAYYPDHKWLQQSAYLHV